jgi:hypothetical protein
MALSSIFYSGCAYIVRHVDAPTGNYVYEGPFDDVMVASRYISRNWTDENMSEEPTLVKLDAPKPREWYDTDMGTRDDVDIDDTIEGDDPDGDYYGNIGC